MLIFWNTINQNVIYDFNTHDANSMSLIKLWEFLKSHGDDVFIIRIIILDIICYVN